MSFRSCFSIKRWTVNTRSGISSCSAADTIPRMAGAGMASASTARVTSGDRVSLPFRGLGPVHTKQPEFDTIQVWKLQKLSTNA